MNKRVVTPNSPSKEQIREAQINLFEDKLSVNINKTDTPSNSIANNNVQNNKVKYQEKQYWVASSSFFDSTLLLFPNKIFAAKPGALDPTQNDQDAFLVKIELYDCSGSKINNLQIDLSSSKVTLIETNDLAEGLKCESGIKHGYLNIKSTNLINSYLRLFSNNSSQVCSELNLISNNHKAFLPVRLSESKDQIIVLLNNTNETNNIKLKLFIGTRSPEISIELPPNALKFTTLNTIFSELKENLINSKLTSQAAYIRISSKEGNSFSYHFIEISEMDNSNFELLGVI